MLLWLSDRHRPDTQIRAGALRRFETRFGNCCRDVFLGDAVLAQAVGHHWAIRPQAALQALRHRVHRYSPEDVDIVEPDVRVFGKEFQAVGGCLRDEHAIEGIAMVRRKMFE